MPTVIQRLATITINIKYNSITPHERHQIKRVTLDRIANALAAARIGIRSDLITYAKTTPGPATIWATKHKTTHQQAALINSATSSHLEYTPHNSMIPALLALADTRITTGKQQITALAAGYRVEHAVNRLLATPVEKRGMHWPAYLAAFPATAAICNLLQYTEQQTADALSLTGCLLPATPFEAFTKGAQAKDIYDAWGSYLGLLATELAATGIAGPANLFEGERGLGKMWLDHPPTKEQLDYAFEPVKSNEIRLGIKPYPSCAAAHPALTAAENLLANNEINIETIDQIEVITYPFGAALSNSSTLETPISIKVNIPFLIAAMLKHGEIKPEYTEPPHTKDPEILQLADKTNVKSHPEENDTVYGRTRYAEITVTMKNGEKLQAKTDRPKWSTPDEATDTEIIEKYNALVSDYLTAKQRDQLKEAIMSLETLTDVSEINRLTVPLKFHQTQKIN